jgi:hypothetical protein
MTGAVLFTMPDELMQAFMQHIRDFDVKNRQCVFQILTSTEMTSEQLVKVLQDISPGFPILEVFKNEKK